MPLKRDRFETRILAAQGDFFSIAILLCNEIGSAITKPKPKELYNIPDDGISGVAMDKFCTVTQETQCS